MGCTFHQNKYWWYKTPMVGDAQAEEPVVEGARSQELQGFEKRAQGCQPSQGETSNMKLLITYWPDKLFFEQICLFLSIWLIITGHNLLQVDNVAGAFLVLMIGMGLSVVTAVVEFFWVSRSALANQNVQYIPWQTPKTAKIHTSPNCQFPTHTSYLSWKPREFSCKFFLAGVKFYRFNAKNWQFTVYVAVITQKIGNFQCILS